MTTTIRHYFKRIATHPLNLLVFILLPVAISVINNEVLNVVIDDAGAGGIIDMSVQYAIVSAIIMVMFAFFGLSLIYDLLYDDFKSARRWRLLASPASLGKFIASNAVASTVVSLVSSALIFLANAIIYDAYVPNLWAFGLIIFVFTIFVQIMGMLLFLLIPKKGTAEAATHAIVWSTTILAGNMFGTINLGTALNFVFQRATPNALATNAIFNLIIENDISQAMIYTGFIGIYVIAAAVIVAIVARRRPF
ncbi:MAG: ABC transporter permease [Defluviitaleaceae bacterium]|nr:ABC transporter permease [Defluviitaleaceae bacterium]